MPSRALAEVAGLAQEVNLLLNLGQSPPGDAHRQSACSRAAVVLMHSNLERYVTTVVRESIAYLNAHAPTRASWPRELCETIYVHVLRGLAADLGRAAGDSEARKKAFRLVKESRKVLGAACDVPLDAQAVFLNSTYPRLVNLERIFWRLGLPDIVARAESVTGGSFRVAIETLNEDRRAIAHGESRAPHVHDVSRTTDTVREFMTTVDEIISSHIDRVTGSKPW